MINKLKPKSEFTRNVLTLMTGTTIAQAIPIAISPILTRLYTPEDFGVFALFLSISGLFSIISTGRYELVIMSPKSNKEAINILVLSIIISCIISIISFFIIFFLYDDILKFVNNKNIGKWLYFIPFTVFFVGLYQSLNFWFNRKKQYKILATNRVIQTGSNSAMSLLFGFNKFSFGLIWGYLFGFIISSIRLFLIFIKEDNKLNKYINRNTMLKVLKKYKKMPIYNLPNAFIDGLRVSGINILISQFFSTAILGQFSMAFKMVQAPMGLIGGSISQVFFQKVSVSNKQDLYNIALSLIKKATLIALPIFLFIFIYAPYLFTFIFGEKWELAGKITSILTPWLFLNFITSPLSTLFIVINKQNLLLIFSIFYMIIPLLIIYLFHDYEILSLFIILSFSMTILLFIFIIMILFLTKKLKG